MQRRKHTVAAPEQPAAAPPSPHIINPTAVYTIEQARAALRLRRDTLQREYKLGRLRMAVRAGRRWILGSWLLTWLESGELRRPQAGQQPAQGPTSAAS